MTAAALTRTAARGDLRQEALRHCAEVTAGSGSNFYLAFLPLPKPRREGIFCVYAFCRHVDDLVDEPQPGHDPRRELQAWRDRIPLIVSGTLPDDEHPIAVGLRITHARFGLRPDDLRAVIDGVEMDLGRRRFATPADLAGYCDKVAGAVGCLCLPVFGADSERARAYAMTLGRAFQLVNILRDVPRDARLGRLYLPLSDLAAFGVTENDVLAGRPTPALRRLLEHEAERARDLLLEAERLLPREDVARLYPARIMAAIYARLLEQVRGRDFDVWQRRPGLPPRVKAVLALGVWLRDRLLRLS